jgi:hypothetical protein
LLLEAAAASTDELASLLPIETAAESHSYRPFAPNDFDFELELAATELALVPVSLNLK